MPNGAGSRAACGRPDSRRGVPASARCGPTDPATDPLVPGRPLRLRLGKETCFHTFQCAGVHRVTRHA